MSGYGDFMRNAALGHFLNLPALKRGMAVQTPVGAPRGATWLTDSIPGVDLYARGYGVTPEFFYDPRKAATSRNLGTFKNPYSNPRHLPLVFKALQAGKRVGLSRGSVSRVGLMGGMIFNVCGSKNDPFFIIPYGDEEALPIITGGEIFTDWIKHSGTAGADAIYKRNMAFDTDVYQADVRLAKVSSVANIDAPGKACYTGGVLYFRPLSGENPNLGQIELPWCDNPFRVNFTDRAETGYVRAAGLDVQKSRQTTLTMQPASGASLITSIGGIHVVGCRVGQAGYDMVSSTLAADGMLVYGHTDAVRATDCYIAGNESYECINNAYEVGGMDGLILESNYGHDVGGNSIVEVWYSCSNLQVRYNKGERAGLVTRLNGENSGAAAYHGGGIWQALFTNFAGTTKSHAAMSNNQYYGNIIGDSRQQGIDIYGGTGTKVLHNTVYNKPDTVTNRLLNMFTNANAAGTCDAEVSNNVFVIGDNGNRKIVDLICGASVTNAQGFAITATLTGDNNVYLNQHSPSQSLVLKTPAGQIDLGASTGFGTYKAALVTAGSTFDQNSTAPFAPTGVSNFADAYIGSDYKPTSLIKTTGKTGYTALTRYNDGLPYDPTSCAIGAYGA